MNRRSFLSLAGASVSVALAGCQDAVDGIGVNAPVTVRIENETDSNRDIKIVAHALEDDRQTYDEAVTATAGQSATVGRLQSFDQYVRFELLEGEDVRDEEETLIGERTQSLVARIRADGLTVEMSQRDPPVTS